MTSKPTPAPLRLELRPSRCLLAFLLATHLLAVAAVLLAQVGPLVKSLALLLVIISLCYHWARAFHPAWRVEALGRDETGWWLQCGGRRQRVGLRSCWVTAHAAGMSFAGRSLLITGDACEPDVFRQLRVQLRFAPGLEDRIAGLG